MTEEFKSIGSTLLELYKPMITECFKDHPDRDRILEDIFAGNLSNDEIDRVFTEASSYTLNKLMETGANLPVVNGNVRLERSDG